LFKDNNDEFVSIPDMKNKNIQEPLSGLLPKVSRVSLSVAKVSHTMTILNIFMKE
jgi:hypothetical protein